MLRRNKQNFNAGKTSDYKESEYSSSNSSDDENRKKIRREDEPIIYNFVDVENYMESSKSSAAISSAFYPTNTITHHGTNIKSPVTDKTIIDTQSVSNKHITLRKTSLSEIWTRIENKIDTFSQETNRRFQILHILMTKLVEQNNKILTNHLGNPLEVNMKIIENFEKPGTEKEKHKIIEEEHIFPIAKQSPMPKTKPVQLEQLGSKIDLIQNELAKLNSCINDKDLPKKSSPVSRIRLTQPSLATKITRNECLFKSSIKTMEEFQDLNSKLTETLYKDHYVAFLHQIATKGDDLIKVFPSIICCELLQKFSYKGFNREGPALKLALYPDYSNWINCIQGAYNIEHEDMKVLLKRMCHLNNIRFNKRRFMSKQLETK